MLTPFVRGVRRFRTIDTCVVACRDPVVRSWVTYAVRAGGLATRIVDDVAELLEALAAEPAALVMEAGFVDRGARHVIAMIRTTGCEVPALVVGREPAPMLHLPVLAPTMTFDGPLDSRALVRALTLLRWLADANQPRCAARLAVAY